MKKIIILLMGLIFLVSCSDMNDIQQEYLDQGENIYVGKADSLLVNGGYNRVQIQGWMHYAKSADKCVIRWKNGEKSDSIIISSTEWQATDTLRILIDNLEEGAQRFFVQTYDKEGNKSLNVECNGYVYGDNYILTATPKIITLMTPKPEGPIVLTWSMSDEAVFVDLKYESDDNSMKTMRIPAAEAETILADWKLGGNVETRTVLVPEVAALDTLYTAWTQLEFPEFIEFSLEKPKIKHLNWPNDAATGHSGSFSGVFDGNISGGGAQFHSGDNVGVPQHLTFDLGVTTNLTRFELWARDDGYNNWNPKKIQIWGIEQINDNSKISLPSMDAGWEDEARSKGWVLLTENVCSNPVNNKLTITNPQKARYIIIRTTEVYGAPSLGTGAYTILREVSLWADSITPVE